MKPDFSADNEDTDELKKWLFKENIRLETLAKELEEERQLIDIQKGILQSQQKKNTLLKKQLENQKILFESQWKMLENETRRLAIDKEAFERDKRMLRDEIYREARRTVSVSVNSRIFFNGVNDAASLKKRYKDLMKIFHPDNVNGDNGTILAIKSEYERLKTMYN